MIKEYDLVFFNGLNVFLSLLQTVVITKFLSQENYGIYGFYLSLSQYIYVFCNWGFLTWGVSQISTNLKRNDIYFTAIIRARMITGGCAYTLLTGYLLITSTIPSLVVYAAFLMYCVALILSPEIVYIAGGRIKSLVVINLLMKFIYIAVVLGCFIVFPMSAEIMFLLFSFLMLFTALVLFFKSSFHYHKNTFYEGSSLSALKAGAPNFLLVLLSFLFASGPVIFSGIFLNAKYFSVIFASTAMIKMIQTAYSPLIQRILPRLNLESVVVGNLFNVIKKDIALSLTFSIICTGLLWLSSPIIVKIVFSEDYEGLETAIRLFSLSLIPGLISTILISQISVYLNIVKSAYWVISAVSIVMFSALVYNFDQLSWVFVLSLMLSGEYILLIVMCLLVYRVTQKTNEIHTI